MKAMKKWLARVCAAALFLGSGGAAQAQVDISDFTTAVTTQFGGVQDAIVAIAVAVVAVFATFVAIRLVKRAITSVTG